MGFGGFFSFLLVLTTVSNVCAVVEFAPGLYPLVSCNKIVKINLKVVRVSKGLY